jgi:hypothetical protein
MKKLSVTIEGEIFEIEFASPSGCESEICVMVNGEPLQVILPERCDPSPPAGSEIEPAGSLEWYIVDGKPYEVLLDLDSRWIRFRSGVYPLEVQDLQLSAAASGSAASERSLLSDGRVKAPIPGQVTRLMVAVGDAAHSGQALLVLEAMKMENEIRAPCSGIVNAIHVLPGQGVNYNQVLLEID